MFDLRDVSDDNLRDVLSSRFPFLKPTSADPVFLFLDETEYGELIPWSDAPAGAMSILYVESWYPRGVPVAAITRVLVVTVESDDLDSAYRGIMRRLERDKEELLDSGRVAIEAISVDELKQRVEAWVGLARGAGLDVDLDWDEQRVVRTNAGYGIFLQARRTEYWRGRG